MGRYPLGNIRHGEIAGLTRREKGFCNLFRDYAERRFKGDPSQRILRKNLLTRFPGKHTGRAVLVQFDTPS